MCGATGQLVGTGKPAYSKKTLFQCYLVHHKSHRDWSRIKPGLRLPLSLGTGWSIFPKCGCIHASWNCDASNTLHLLACGLFPNKPCVLLYRPLTLPANIFKQGRRKAVPVHGMTAYTRHWGTAPLILNLWITWTGAVRFAPRPL